MTTPVERSYKKLYSAIEWSRKQLSPFRKHRHDAVREFVGNRYSDDGTLHPVYINLLQQAVGIYTRQLAARSPQVMVSTRFPDLKPSAYELQLATNHLIEEIKLLGTLRMAVQEALFGPMAIVKIGMTLVDGESANHHGEQYYADIVTLDDWVHDMSVNRWDQIGYCGNRYRMLLDHAREFKGFDKKLREKLQASEKQYANEGGDERDNEFSIGEPCREEHDDFVDLYEIFLPGKKRIITCVADDTAGSTIMPGKPLADWEWTGPRRGPYHKLEYTSVPGNTLGLSFVASLMPLHELINELTRKLASQAKRQKTVVAYMGEDDEDARNIIQSRDGVSCKVENPNALQTLEYGGINQVTLGFALQMRDQFSAGAGNLDVLGGLSPQADTLGQERLLSESASKIVDDMQDQTINFTGEICKDLGEYLFYDPLISLPITKQVPGTRQSVTTTWPVVNGVDLRDGDFVEYNYSIRPYSMAHETPAMKLNTLSQFFQQFVVPNIPMMMEQGIAINFEKLFTEISRLSNMDSLRDILLFTGKPTMPSEKPVAPSATHGAYNKTSTQVRVNRPGATNQGKSQIMQAMLNGGNPQGAEMASLTRPTG